jgi:predicted phosphodiesterase
MISILHISDVHAYGAETRHRLGNLALEHSSCDVIALTGDSEKLPLPSYWNDWPQHLKLSVPGNHDSDATFVNLNSWVHQAPWFRRYQDLAFMGIDTSDLKRPFGKILEEQLDPFWEEKITDVSAFVLLTHSWPEDHEFDRADQILAKFIDQRPLVILDGHFHPRRTKWETEANFGSIVCFRSTVISCEEPKGNGNLITWNGNRFDSERVQGEYEKPKYKITRVAGEIKIGHTNTHKKKSQSKAATEAGQDKWIKHCGIVQRRSQRICNSCGKALPRH